MIKEITTSELADALKTTDIQLVDARRVDAYNGWRFAGEQRGGHVPGARSLPADWLQDENWQAIVAAKGIVPRQRVIVYGYVADEAMAVAKRFVELGYGDVRVYPGFVDEWSANTGLPMDRLKRYRNLVYPEWVQELVAGRRPPEYDGNRFVVCHSHYMNRPDYDAGHIPGAIALDTLELEAPETWNRRSPAELKSTLERHGITADTTVVMYGRFSSPRNEDPHPGSNAGHLGAFRCAAIMMYAGVKDVRILNGGIASWEARGLPLSGDETRPEPVRDFGARIPARPGIFIDTPQAKQVLASPDKNLVSVRSWQEFIGNVSGYNYIFRTGRIPGAVFGNCGSDAYHMENYRNRDHTTREYHEIERMWMDAGITPGKFNAFYCGTGWRASEAFMNGFLMGWENIAIYDGGWFEWSNDPDNPIETGIPE